MKLCSLFLLVLLLLTAASFAQRKRWRTTVYTTTQKLKGFLKEVNDSSVVMATKHGFETLLFTQIKSFRFVRVRDDGFDYASGGVIGAIGGAVIGANGLANGKEGEPEALAGLAGGIGGGIAGALIGAFTAPVLFKWLGSKKIIMVQSPEFYQSLPLLLKQHRIM